MKNLVIISSPSGCGKDTVVRRLLKEIPESRKLITTTTRPPRDYESDGIHYHFTTWNEFLSGISMGLFLEWQDVHGEMYGVTIDEIYDHYDESCNVQFAIVDVLGALRIRDSYNRGIKDYKLSLIFLKPPSKESLISRLQERSSETIDQIMHRLERYDLEMKVSSMYDHVVVNDNLDDTINEILEILL